MSANVADLPATAAAEFGDALAFVDPDGASTTWGELDRRVDAVADGVRHAGLERGDTVGVMFGNSSAFAAASWGVLRAGATVVRISAGERVRAAIVLMPGADVSADGLVARCRDRLARYKLPRDIRILDTLPRLATGKLFRRELRR